MTTSELFAAVKSGNVAAVEALLARDPTLANARDDDGMSPLITATYHGRREVVDLLLARGATPDIFSAAALGRTDDVRRLLDADPSLVGARSADGWTTLHLAAHFGQRAALELLLSRGADVRARSTNGLDNTALHAATAGSDAHAVVPPLLAAGADVDDRQHGGYTALHAAAQHGDIALARLLLAHGADPAIRTDDGRSAHDMASAGGHADLAALLS